MINDYLFVYGTLKRSANSEMSNLLATNADFVDYACYRGELYQINGYPGAVPSVNPEHIVPGEVYRLPEANRLLTCLDQYEGYGPDFPEPNEYRRQKQEVMLNGGAIVSAWVYLYNHATANLEPVTMPMPQTGNGVKPATACYADGDRFARRDNPAL